MQTSKAPMILALLVVPQSARAWVGEPLCAVPESEALSMSLLASNETAGMCVPSPPHLLRAPTFDVCAPMSGRESPEDAPQVAARALARARELEANGLNEDAHLSLRVVEATLPRIADHVAVMRARLLERLGDYERAAQAYREAIGSVNGDLSARAQVGYVGSLLRGHDPRAEGQLDALLRRYPHLPEAPGLKLDLAKLREARGEVRTAIATYRLLDLSMPGYPVARRARERLAALLAQGHVIAPYTAAEQLSRAEKLVRSGPVELAREAVAVLESTPVPKHLLAQREALRATLADHTGDVLPPETEKASAPPFEQERAWAEKRLTAAIANKKKLTKQRPAQIYLTLQEASRYQLTAIADELVLELARRQSFVPVEIRFGALTVAAGTASDAALVSLADTLVEHPSMGAAARYHRARALERQGKRDEARSDLQRVLEQDTSFTRFYANFAEQRLRALELESACTSPGRKAECNRGRIDAALRALEGDGGLDVQAATAYIQGVAREHGHAFPWLLRALDLIALGELDAAADEVYETFLAFRSAGRRGTLRAGREAVYRGTGSLRPAPDLATRRARLSLDAEARLALARAASALGDWGTATYFGGPSWAEAQPYPYAKEVAAAARRHGLDPDLLFAVMRVESVFQRRIISHAGAIGLMQIMPRTGRLIADKLGRYDATTTDLLDARTNIEFSAWYLSSLLARMDGRLPLAIASYNGGPHNVRKWIRSQGEHVPLDAFLERIPFTETRRYVRRVLGYYARYKAERGEKIDLIALTLPADKPSEVAF